MSKAGLGDLIMASDQRRRHLIAGFLILIYLSFQCVNLDGCEQLTDLSILSLLALKKSRLELSMRCTNVSLLPSSQKESENTVIGLIAGCPVLHLAASNKTASELQRFRFFVPCLNYFILINEEYMCGPNTECVQCASSSNIGHLIKKKKRKEKT